MGNIATYQVKILFHKEKSTEWLKQYDIFETLKLLRSARSTHTYYVPFYIDDSRFEFQFGEKWALFEGYDEEYKQEVQSRIWKADTNNFIHKIFYRSSDGLDKIFSATKEGLTKERYCRYGFDKIKFVLKEHHLPTPQEIELFNINQNEITLNGSYHTGNCRTRILGISQIVEDPTNNINDYYKSITGLCSMNYEPPTNFFPYELNDSIKLFFRSCQEVKFYWKNRQTLKMNNQGTDIYPDLFSVESDDHWDNVVDQEYFKELNPGENRWNSKIVNAMEQYTR